MCDGNNFLFSYYLTIIVEEVNKGRDGRKA